MDNIASAHIALQHLVSEVSVNGKGNFSSVFLLDKGFFFYHFFETNFQILKLQGLTGLHVLQIHKHGLVVHDLLKCLCAPCGLFQRLLYYTLSFDHLLSCDRHGFRATLDLHSLSGPAVVRLSEHGAYRRYSLLKIFVFVVSSLGLFSHSYVFRLLLDFVQIPINQANFQNLFTKVMWFLDAGGVYWAFGLGRRLVYYSVGLLPLLHYSGGLGCYVVD